MKTQSSPSPRPPIRSNTPKSLLHPENQPRHRIPRPRQIRPLDHLQHLQILPPNPPTLNKNMRRNSRQLPLPSLSLPRRSYPPNSRPSIINNTPPLPLINPNRLKHLLNTNLLPRSLPLHSIRKPLRGSRIPRLQKLPQPFLEPLAVHLRQPVLCLRPAPDSVDPRAPKRLVPGNGHHERRPPAPERHGRRPASPVTHHGPDPGEQPRVRRLVEDEDVCHVSIPADAAPLALIVSLPHASNILLIKVRPPLPNNSPDTNPPHRLKDPLKHVLRIRKRHAPEPDIHRRRLRVRLQERNQLRRRRIL
ncbi:hypothetical protein CMEL01_00950 [Colletotrichum melonis]|uniref:Uncharacterized protein n=1 Tax=Colletotrichum melonis TaxID=1209925 RepID=A0AAI9Y2N3_9PEZI|nr:hypothetical protein CMEL01_00950 [Colletotrichum melonis]